MDTKPVVTDPMAQQIIDLEIQIADMQIAHTHAIHDLLGLFHKVQREAELARHLLEDLPHAARNGRTEVIVEYTDRAYDHLTKALAVKP